MAFAPSRRSYPKRFLLLVTLFLTGYALFAIFWHLYSNIDYKEPYEDANSQYKHSLSQNVQTPFQYLKTKDSPRVFWVNMDNAISRNAFMIAQFIKYKIKNYRVPAILTKDIIMPMFSLLPECIETWYVIVLKVLQSFILKTIFYPHMIQHDEQC